MNRTSPIRSWQKPKQPRFLIVLLGAALALWPALIPTAFAQHQKQTQEKQVNPQSAIRNPQSQTAFIYQGQLKDGGVPVSGAVDFQFTLYTAQTGGTELGSTVYENLVLTDGLFKMELDIGRATVNGQESWVEMAVRPSGSEESYTVLSPRQKLTPTPYAIFAQQERWSVIGVPVGFPSDRELVNDIDAVQETKTPAPASTAVAAPQGMPNFLIKNDQFGRPTLDSSISDDGMIVHIIGPSVGIGTMTPAFGAKLDVVGKVKATQFEGDGSLLTDVTATDPTKVAKAGDTMTGALRIAFSGAGSDAEPGGGGFLQLGSLTGGNLALDGNEIMARNNGQTSTLFLNHDGGTVTLVANGPGNVGIGTTSPETKLQVIGDENNGTTAALKISSGENMLIDGNEIDTLDSGLYLNNNTNRHVILADGGGSVGIGTGAASPMARLDVNGNLRVNGDLRFARQKACSAVISGNFRDTILVPSSWTEATCSAYAQAVGTTAYQLWCINENSFSFGSPGTPGATNGGVPSPNCGW